ncbi:hypothetical protein Mgra_00004580 [Meloidogyne graminicola]|uniref:Uncharacterized protein n=1 Tax=Meloidogyne graminicola TaxID=189291 RepID=A0A8S9ZRE9_9BILA|nr:hypothetical protein Mgra_00004580 [Meloidogyne graminicola]
MSEHVSFNDFRESLKAIKRLGDQLNVLKEERKKDKRLIEIQSLAICNNYARIMELERYLHIKPDLPYQSSAEPVIGQVQSDIMSTMQNYEKKYRKFPQKYENYPISKNGFFFFF